MPEVDAEKVALVQASEVRGVLPAGTLLRGYELTGVLGQGGFGVTYRARDATLGRDVAIKEYLPTALALREGGTTVVPRSTEVADQYVYGRERFLEEARTLARFARAPAIVRVHDFLEANGTAYMVMEMVEGETLDRRLKREGHLAWPAIDAMLGPLLDGLEEVHATGFLHRDIKPSNIILDSRGAPTLIDFGASRAAIAGQSAAMTAIFTPGYAAAEQFTSGKQGPWTDIYGLAATLHHAVTGGVPPSAIDRILGDTYESLRHRQPEGYAPGLLAGIDAGLLVHGSERPQSIAAWRPILDGSTDFESQRTVALPKRAGATSRRPPLGVWLALTAVALVALAVGGYWFAMHPADRDRVAATQTAPPQQADEAAKAKEDELARLRTQEASRKAEEEARQKAVAEEALRRQIEEETRRKIEAELAQQRQADEDARQKAEAEAKARQMVDEGGRRTAEVAESGLRLSPLDRQHVQVALTSLGFNTNGSDGVFGPATRNMIAAWQKSRSYPVTGFLSGAQDQELLKSAAAAITRFDDDQKKTEETKKTEGATKKPEDERPRQEPAEARILSITAKSGEEVRIGTHGNAKDCTSLDVPRVELISPPANGKVSIRAATETRRGCSGVFQAIGVYYTANPGFVGTDRFDYDRKADSFTTPGVAGVRHVTINVQSAAAAAAAAPAPVPPAAPMPGARQDPDQAGIVEAKLKKTAGGKECGDNLTKFVRISPTRADFNFTDGWHSLAIDASGNYGGTLTLRSNELFRVSGNAGSRSGKLENMRLGCVWNVTY